MFFFYINKKGMTFLAKLIINFGIMFFFSFSRLFHPLQMHFDNLSYRRMVAQTKPYCLYFAYVMGFLLKFDFTFFFYTIVQQTIICGWTSMNKISKSWFCYCFCDWFLFTYVIIKKNHTFAIAFTFQFIGFFV